MAELEAVVLLYRNAPQEMRVPGRMMEVEIGEWRGAFRITEVVNGTDLLLQARSGNPPLACLDRSGPVSPRVD